MKCFYRCLAIFSALVVFSFVSPSDVSAAEGLIEMRSTTRESYRCFASSFLMQDSAYTLLISCRDLIYPASDTVFSYVLWATPQAGGNPVRLGELGYGRLTARMTVPFTSMYVTTEPNPAVGRPSGPIVMRGNIQRITFLDRETTPSPRPTESVEEAGVVEEETTPTPEAGQISTGEKLMTAIRRAGLAAFLALIALIGLIFAITRARG